jgi:RNA polymerase sigma factor (TIGR02999 family)
VSEVTRILSALDAGDPQAARQLLPLVYEELRKLAAGRMAAERPGQTLQPTALVHEAYLRLVGGQRFEGREHFFAAAAEAMRRILVNHARDRNRLKRGGRRVRVALLDHADSLAEDPDLILSLDELLTRLGEEDATAARVAHLHLFGGLSVEEAGAALGVSRAVAYRNWKYARAWLRDALKNNPESVRHFSPGWGIDAVSGGGLSRVFQIDRGVTAEPKSERSDAVEKKEEKIASVEGTSLDFRDHMAVCAPAAMAFPSGYAYPNGDAFHALFLPVGQATCYVSNFRLRGGSSSLH